MFYTSLSYQINSYQLNFHVFFNNHSNLHVFYFGATYLCTGQRQGQIEKVLHPYATWETENRGWLSQFKALIFSGPGPYASHVLTALTSRFFKPCYSVVLYSGLYHVAKLINPSSPVTIVIARSPEMQFCCEKVFYANQMCLPAHRFISTVHPSCTSDLSF